MADSLSTYLENWADTLAESLEDDSTMMQAFRDAADAVTATRAAWADRRGELDEQKRRQASLRVELARNDVSPAEAESLAEELSEAVIATRVANAAALAAEIDLQDAERELARLGATVERTRAALERVGADAAEVTAWTAARAKRIDALAAAEGADDVRARASDFLSGESMAAAESRLENDVTAEMIALARARHHAYAAKTESLRAVAARQRNEYLRARRTTDGPVTSVERAEGDLERVEAELDRLDRLEGLFAGAVATIVASTKGAMSDADRANVTSGDLPAAGKPVAALAASLADAEHAAIEAREKLDRFNDHLEDQEVEPTPEQEDEQSALAEALSSAEDAEETARTAYEESDLDDLEEWEAAVPTRIHDDLLRFLRAEAELGAIRDAPPVAEVAARIEESETVVVAALQTYRESEDQASEAEAEWSDAEKALETRLTIDARLRQSVVAGES